MFRAPMPTWRSWWARSSQVSARASPQPMVTWGPSPQRWALTARQAAVRASMSLAYQWNSAGWRPWSRMTRAAARSRAPVPAAGSHSDAPAGWSAMSARVMRACSSLTSGEVKYSPLLILLRWLRRVCRTAPRTSVARRRSSLVVRSSRPARSAAWVMVWALLRCSSSGWGCSQPISGATRTAVFRGEEREGGGDG